MRGCPPWPQASCCPAVVPAHCLSSHGRGLWPRPGVPSGLYSVARPSYCPALLGTWMPVFTDSVLQPRLATGEWSHPPGPRPPSLRPACAGHWHPASLLPSFFLLREGVSLRRPVLLGRPSLLAAMLPLALLGFALRRAP